MLFQRRLSRVATQIFDAGPIFMLDALQIARDTSHIHHKNWSRRRNVAKSLLRHKVEFQVSRLVHPHSGPGCLLLCKSSIVAWWGGQWFMANVEVRI